MLDQAAAAQLLFGDTAPKSEASGNTDSTPPPAAANPTTQQVEAPEPRTNDQQAEALFDNKEKPAPFMDVPDDVKAIRESAERKMFDAQTALREALPDDDFKTDEHTAEDSAKAAREVREIVADLELAPDDWKGLRQRAIDMRVEPVAEADQIDATIQALNARFGNQAKQALRDAQLLVQRDIRVAKIIEGWGLGNDPQTVVLMAEKARSQIAAGKLKRK